MKGKFIVLEGIDGTGKSTLAPLLAQYLFGASKSNDVLLTREPTAAFIAPTIKSGTNEQRAMAMTDAFIRDRVAHLRSLIDPSIDNGVHVICDRYSLSTYAYQSVQGALLCDIQDAHSGKKIRAPDLTILLTCDIDRANERLAARRNNDANDTAHDEWKRAVQDRYVELSRNALYQQSFRIVMIDTTDLSPEQVLYQVILYVDALFANS